MVGRWLVYLSTVAGCTIFYLAYQGWFAWLALVGVWCLPWLSLLLSLPAMLTVRVRPLCPSRLRRGQPVFLTLESLCPLPIPGLQYRMQVLCPMQGAHWHRRPGDPLPTDHCGTLELRPVRVSVTDYLGLFRLSVGRRYPIRVEVWPEEMAVADLPELSRYLDHRWKPRPGGGYGENHELRLYRPGDDLRQIHWKLSAKTGKLILREPLEPAQGGAQLRLTLNGTPEELDRKLGRLLWISRHLLSRDTAHELCCLTGQGLERFSISSEPELRAAMGTLLSRDAAPGGDNLPDPTAHWHYTIGGEPDED